MKTISEIKLRDFEFWAGAKNNRNRFSYEELEQLEAILEDLSEDPMDETELNDLFWFEPELLCEWLGLNEEEWIKREENYYENSLLVDIPLF